MDLSNTGRGETSETSLRARLYDVFTRTWDLGLIAFGGPPVHVHILHRRFVDGVGGSPWLDNQTFQEIFVVTQSLPGPASTRLLFGIVQVHAGVPCAFLALLLWILPGASVMFALSIAAQRIGTTLPSPVYPLLSGLNAATVGGIALAAVQLSRRVITDSLTRCVLLLAACGGLCYSALWYYPVLILSGGFVTLLVDSHKYIWSTFSRLRNGSPGQATLATNNRTNSHESVSQETLERVDPPSLVDISKYSPSVTTGMILIIAVTSVFVVLLILRSTSAVSSYPLAVFTNFYLAGTLIIGGGPVVTPLLREYTVEPGWVSPRDFLLGLAVVYALPGPNFNFAVYLGSLAFASHGSFINTLLGAFLGALGLFSPGILISIGALSGLHRIRKQPVIVSVLRGMSAAAVGLIYTAVYRLWQVGYLKIGQPDGSSLAEEPWWLAIAAVAYTSVEWFGVPIPLAIVTGGVAGLAWWDVVGSKR